MVKIVVNNVWSRISGLKNIDLVDTLDKITSFYVEGYQFTKAFREGFWDKKTNQFVQWDGKRHLLTKRMVFPSGLLFTVCEFLNRHNVEYEIEDKRPTIEPQPELSIQHYTPREYQKEAVAAAVDKGCGIIRMGTGSGKTLVAAMLTAKYNLPTMVYVVGKDLLYQFHEEMEKALGQKVGIIGDGKCILKRFNVCSIWTAITAFNLKQKVSLDDEDWSPEVYSIDVEEKKAIKFAVENSQVAIYDEAHFIATDTIQSIFKASKQCKYRFGLSGTDWRDDGADILLESVCGPRIFNLPSSKVIDLGFLVSPKIALFEVPPLPEELPKHYPTIYSKYITTNNVRNRMIEDAARALIKKGRRLLILVRYISHGKALASQLSDIPLFFVNGEIDGETRKEVKESFERGELKCLIASSVYDIGVDIPSLDALILGGGGKSTVRALQRIGRVIRIFDGKEDAIVVDFIDNVRYLDKHSAIRISVYETESRFIIKWPKGFDSSKIKRSRKVAFKIGSS
jgi:superfamily II DNA or RNA helicase